MENLNCVAFGEDYDFPHIDSPDGSIAEEVEPADEWSRKSILEVMVKFLTPLVKNHKTGYGMTRIPRRLIMVCNRLIKEELTDDSNGEGNEFHKFIKEAEIDIFRSIKFFDTYIRLQVFLLFCKLHQYMKYLRASSAESFRSDTRWNDLLDATSRFICRVMEHCRPDVTYIKSLLDSLDGMILCSNIVWKRKNRTINEWDSSNITYMEPQSDILFISLLALIVQAGKDHSGSNIRDTRNLKEALSIRYEGQVESVKVSVSRFNESLRDFVPAEQLSHSERYTRNLLMPPILQVIRAGVDCLQGVLEQLNRDRDANSNRYQNGDGVLEEVIKKIESLRVLCSFRFNYFKTGELRTDIWEELFADIKCIPFLKPCLSDGGDVFKSYKNVHIINRRIHLSNSLLFYMKYNQEREYECLVEEGISDGGIQWNEVEGELRAPPWWNFWKHFSNTNVNFLFYEEEKKRMEEVRQCGLNPLKHLNYVAAPLFLHLPSNTVERITRGQEYADVLWKCTESLAGSDHFERLKAIYPQIAVLCFSAFLFVLDVFTDCYAAKRHHDDGNVLYTCLTILFVMAPLVLDMSYLVYMKIQNIRDELNEKMTWKHVLYPEQVKLLHRSLKSILYAVKSRKDYSDDVTKLYSEIVYLRYKKRRGERHINDWMQHQEYLVGASCYSRMVWNENSLFDSRFSECLNESAPQLLLQLTIAMMKILNGEHVGPMSFVGIATSLASFALGMHLYRYQLHFGYNSSACKSLTNDFKLKYRLMDASVNMCIFCARFIAISAMISICGWWFLAIALPYIGLLYLCMCLCHEDEHQYWETSRYKITKFWPIHRLLTIPCVWKLWKCDSVQHLLFHLETFIMAFVLIYLIPIDHPIAGLRWILPCVILFLNFICYPVLYRLNNYLHPVCRLCK